MFVCITQHVGVSWSPDSQLYWLWCVHCVSNADHWSNRATKVQSIHVILHLVY